MAAPASQFTIKIGEEKFDADVASNVTTRALNLSEPANGDDCEIIFLESTVTEKWQALELIDRIRQQVNDGDWPLA